MTMMFLLGSLRSREKDRSVAFTTIGLIAVAVQDDIKIFLPKIMEVIRVSLPAKVQNCQKYVLEDLNLVSNCTIWSFKCCT